MSASEEFMGRVAAARKEAGMTQSQMAELLGITRAGYAQIEGGKVRLVYDYAVTLSNYLGVALHFDPPAALAEPSPQVHKARARKLIHTLQRRLERVDRLLSRKSP